MKLATRTTRQKPFAKQQQNTQHVFLAKNT